MADCFTSDNEFNSAMAPVARQCERVRKKPIKNQMNPVDCGRRQRGQASIEYALFIGIAALMGIVFLSTFTPIIQQGVLTFNVQLEKELVTGGFPEAATAWEN